MSIYIRKDNVTHEQKEMPMLFPADRVYLDGDTDKNVQEALTYSTDEHVVGKWIDGSILYEKTIDCGALPNATTKTTAHGISNIKTVVDIRGFAMNNSETIFIPLPFATKDLTGVEIYADKTYITYDTSANRSSYVKSYVTLLYTKMV